MVIYELTAAQCVELLQRTSLGRLACTRSNQPYVVPVFFSFDADAQCLYSFSTVGRKIEWMRFNPKVCVEVDEITDPFSWTTVLITGRYEEVRRDSHQHDDARRRVQELFHERPGWWLPGAAELAAGEEQNSPVFYRIRILEMSGRRTARPSA